MRDLEKKRAWQRRYMKSEKGRAAQHRYDVTEKGKARVRRYQQTTKGQLARHRINTLWLSQYRTTQRIDTERI